MVFAPFFTSRCSGWRLKASAGPFLLGNLSAPPVSNRCSARVAEQIEVLPHVRDQKNDQDIDQRLRYDEVNPPGNCAVGLHSFTCCSTIHFSIASLSKR